MLGVQVGDGFGGGLASWWVYWRSEPMQAGAWHLSATQWPATAYKFHVLPRRCPFRHILQATSFVVSADAEPGKADVGGGGAAAAGAMPGVGGGAGGFNEEGAQMWAQAANAAALGGGGAASQKPVALDGAAAAAAGVGGAAGAAGGGGFFSKMARALGMGGAGAGAGGAASNAAGGGGPSQFDLRRGWSEEGMGAPGAGAGGGDAAGAAGAGAGAAAGAAVGAGALFTKTALPAIRPKGEKTGLTGAAASAPPEVHSPGSFSGSLASTGDLAGVAAGAAAAGTALGATSPGGPAKAALPPIRAALHKLPALDPALAAKSFSAPGRDKVQLPTTTGGSVTAAGAGGKRPLPPIAGRKGALPSLDHLSGSKPGSFAASLPELPSASAAGAAATPGVLDPFAKAVLPALPPKSPSGGAGLDGGDAAAAAAAAAGAIPGILHSESLNHRVAKELAEMEAGSRAGAGMEPLMEVRGLAGWVREVKGLAVIAKRHECLILFRRSVLVNAYWRRCRREAELAARMQHPALTGLTGVQGRMHYRICFCHRPPALPFPAGGPGQRPLHGRGDAPLGQRPVRARLGRGGQRPCGRQRLPASAHPSGEWGGGGNGRVGWNRTDVESVVQLGAGGVPCCL